MDDNPPLTLYLKSAILRKQKSEWIQQVNPQTTFCLTRTMFYPLWRSPNNKMKFEKNEFYALEFGHTSLKLLSNWWIAPRQLEFRVKLSNNIDLSLLYQEVSSVRAPWGWWWTEQRAAAAFAATAQQLMPIMADQHYELVSVRRIPSIHPEPEAIDHWLREWAGSSLVLGRMCKVP